MRMKPLTLRTIAEVTGGRYIGPSESLDTCITGVVRDHRDAAPGNLFVCFRGERVDGHEYIADAFSAGALACLVEREPSDYLEGAYILVQSTFESLKIIAEHYRALFLIPIIGITGSVGKTTTKEMVAAVLSRRFKVHKNEGNLNNEIGVPLTLLAMKEGHEIAIVEMGISDFGEMRRIARMVRPTASIFTIIGHSHLEFLRNPEGVLRAKSEMFEYMPTDGSVLINGDDALLSSLSIPNPLLRFGLSSGNDVFASQVENTGTEITRILIEGTSEPFWAEIPAFGSHLVYAALAAAALGNHLGLSQAMIQDGLKNYMPVGSRAKVIQSDTLTIIDDSYNANPNSMASGLLSLCTLSGRRLAILGDMKELGLEEKELHREIGRLAAEHGLDCLLCCGDLAQYIYEGVISYLPDDNLSHGHPTQAWYFPSKDELYAVLPSLLAKGDSILVKASHSMRFPEIVEELKALSETLT